MVDQYERYAKENDDGEDEQRGPSGAEPTTNTDPPGGLLGWMRTGQGGTWISHWRTGKHKGYFSDRWTMRIISGRVILVG
jgi:hypothetical protein